MDHGRFAICDALPRLQFIEEHEVDELNEDDGDEGDGDGEIGSETREVFGGVGGIEEKRPDDVSGGGAGVVDGHDDGFLGGASGVADDPGDDQGVAAEEERKEVVGCEEGALFAVVAGEDIEHRETGDNGKHERDEDDGLEAELVRGVRSEEDDEELDGAKGHVEEGGDGFAEAESVEDQRAEDVRDAGADVEKESHGEPEVGFGLQKDLQDLGPSEDSGSDTGLVGSKAFHCLGAFLFGQEAC